MTAPDPIQSLTPVAVNADLMPLIANRKLLNWTGAYFVAFAMVAVCSFHYGVPFDAETLRASPFYYVFAIPAFLIVMGVTISALIHIFEHRRFGWLIPIVFTAYLGAFLYGYAVASNPKFAE